MESYGSHHSFKCATIVCVTVLLLTSNKALYLVQKADKATNEKKATVSTVRQQEDIFGRNFSAFPPFEFV